MSDWPKRRWGPFDVPHPDSPAGRNFDYSALDVPHPNSPAGRNFDYSSSLGVAHPNSPAGRSGLWLGGDLATNEMEAREGIQETILTDRVYGDLGESIMAADYAQKAYAFRDRQ
jgi:hypothetical protein